MDPVGVRGLQELGDNLQMAEHRPEDLTGGDGRVLTTVAGHGLGQVLDLRGGRPLLLKRSPQPLPWLGLERVVAAPDRPTAEHGGRHLAEEFAAFQVGLHGGERFHQCGVGRSRNGPLEESELGRRKVERLNKKAHIRRARSPLAALPPPDHARIDAQRSTGLVKAVGHLPLGPAAKLTLPAKPRVRSAATTLHGASL